MKIFKLLCACAITAQFSLALAQKAQQSIAMPTMPSMPSMSTPTIGSGFYVPGANGFYGANSQQQSAKNSQKNSSAAPSASTVTSANADSALSDGTDSIALAKNQNDILEALASKVSPTSALNQNVLTTGDISSLDKLGLFGSVSSLIGKNSGTSATTSVTNEKLLKQVLTELQELKAQVQAEGTATAKKSALSVPSKKILRFNLNGQDVITGIRQVFFSKEETDGTFLLTGDRVLSVNGSSIPETFYLLFKAVGTNCGTTLYDVSVSTSIANAIESGSAEKSAVISSPLAVAASKEKLSASRTGNLVSLRVNEDNLHMDLLLGLDN